jgi:hypothetical protein
MFLRNNIQKDVFFSENFWETSHACQMEFHNKEYPTMVSSKETSRGTYFVGSWWK